MLPSYHRQICQRVLGKIFSSRALDCIIAANLGQDKIRYQLGHPEFHYDDNAFEAGDAYIETQRKIIVNTLTQNREPILAWQAFGRLTHAAQDFYAHSNYVRLWLAARPEDELPAPSEVEALTPEVLNHPELHSGRVYLWDWLAFIPGLYSLACRLLPEDSHTHMNLDTPKRKDLFPYAFEAAIKRTIHEYQLITRGLSQEAWVCFTES